MDNYEFSAGQSTARVGMVHDNIIVETYDMDPADIKRLYFNIIDTTGDFMIKRYAEDEYELGRS